MSELDDFSRPFRSTFPDEASGFRTQEWRHGVARSPEELIPLHATLLHAFSKTAQRDQSTGVTLVSDRDGPDEHRSYRDLYRAAKRYASALSELEIGRGDRVLIVLPTSFEFLLAFFGVQRLGAIPVPSYPPAMLERAELALSRLGHVAERAGAVACITNKRLRPLLGGLALRVATLRHIVTTENLDAGGSKPAPKPTIGRWGSPMRSISCCGASRGTCARRPRAGSSKSGACAT